MTIQLSRVGRAPVSIPKGVQVTIDAQHIKVKGGIGSLDFVLRKEVGVKQVEDSLVFSLVGTTDLKARALVGTSRQIIKNMVHGVSVGFEKKLVMKGVGYRSQVTGKKLILTVGKSHPDTYDIPEGITIELPTQTDITVKGSDKQKVGQVAAEIRAFRPPEPYKGKGIRYHDEVIILKEGKKA